MRLFCGVPICQNRDIFPMGPRFTCSAHSFRLVLSIGRHVQIFATPRNFFPSSTQDWWVCTKALALQSPNLRMQSLFKYFGPYWHTPDRLPTCSAGSQQNSSWLTLIVSCGDCPAPNANMACSCMINPRLAPIILDHSLDRLSWDPESGWIRRTCSSKGGWALHNTSLCPNRLTPWAAFVGL